MNKLVLIIIYSIYKIKKISSFSSKEVFDNHLLYLNEVCSNNGEPQYDEETKNITCICENKYANEPREKYRTYINGYFIQCSYERKSRTKALFLAAVFPLGLDYLYLEHYFYFFLVFIFCIIVICFNIISLVLNYKVVKKNEEIKRQIKLKRSNNKFEISNISEINEKSVKIFNVINKVLTFILIVYWIYNLFVQGFGFVMDKNYVELENDLGYLFQWPDRD